MRRNAALRSAGLVLMIGAVVAFGTLVVVLGEALSADRVVRWIGMVATGLACAAVAAIGLWFTQSGRSLSLWALGSASLVAPVLFQIESVLVLVAVADNWDIAWALGVSDEIVNSIAITTGGVLAGLGVGFGFGLRDWRLSVPSTATGGAGLALYVLLFARDVVTSSTEGAVLWLGVMPLQALVLFATSWWMLAGLARAQSPIEPANVTSPPPAPTISR